MTDGQSLAAAVIAAAGTFGGLIKWSASILRDAIKENNRQMRKALEDNQTIIRDNTLALNRVFEFLGRVDARTETVHDRMVEIHNEISETHDVASDDPTPVHIPRRAASQPYFHVKKDR